MEMLMLWAVFAVASIGSVSAGCPAVCTCPIGRTICPPGVSAVPDGCGCCKVCAAQLNEDCHLSRPCDHHKGLECNYGNDVARTNGVCRARSEGRTCEYNGRMYQNGESFHAGCKHQCTCIDGAVGCEPLCPIQAPPATPSCPAPYLVKVPGQCCPSVDCHKGARALPPAPADPHWYPYPHLYPHTNPQPYPFAYPYPYKPDKTLGNELMEAGKKWDKMSRHKHQAARSEGRTCEYNGRMYQNGESFHAGCKHQCTCIDGAVGCEPLCPIQAPPATPSCPAPYLVKVPGQCCPSVDCHKGARALPPAPADPHWYPHPHLYPHTNPQPYPFAYPYPYKPDKTLGNELMEAGKKWDKMSRHKHQAAWRQVGGQCVVQTTSWSPCSRSCGMGVSSRVTNDNARCKLVKETRLCNVRPCSSLQPVTLKKGKKCSRTHKAPEPLRLSYAGCRSARLYRPNYCGVCVDGRCCSPRRTRTASVAFACPDGERFQKDVMFVRSCKCGDECAHLNEAALPPQRWLHGDTHKFAD
ncbi:hypothetical protein AAFF_G00339690 [Aldrovandia affinis]|uniref:Protein CYR61-like n=1 Tax=Aldrovandia affinis TaxID=143900 RepID=A0AAD7SMG9_9TELE|nr:hypothetical protein AAFF_G00339690 [Aldrovandia affinis]